MEEKDLPVVAEESAVKLKEDMNSLIEDIVKEDNTDKLKDLTALFNVHQAKKDLLRSLQLNDLLDIVTAQMQERFIKHPDCFTNKELLDYLKVAQEAIDKAGKGSTTISDAPAIQYNQQNNVNISIADTLDRDSRERVNDVISKILGKINSEKELNSELEPVLNNVNIKTEDN